MDKNKSLYKLKGLPRILYINLDAEPERAKCLEDQFKYLRIIGELEYRSPIMTPRIGISWWVSQIN